MMDPEYYYDTQGQPEKLRRLAFYHAARATELNKVTPGATQESSFHWGAAIDLVGLANLLEMLEKERVERGKRRPLNTGMA